MTGKQVPIGESSRLQEQGGLVLPPRLDWLGNRPHEVFKGQKHASQMQKQKWQNNRARKEESNPPLHLRQATPLKSWSFKLCIQGLGSPLPLPVAHSTGCLTGRELKGLRFITVSWAGAWQAPNITRRTNTVKVPSAWPKALWFHPLQVYDKGPFPVPSFGNKDYG